MVAMTVYLEGNLHDLERHQSRWNLDVDHITYLFAQAILWQWG